MNGLPEAISHEQPDFERWLELFMTAGEAESTLYVMRLQIWYTHYCCVKELLTLCRLLQRHREEHLEAKSNSHKTYTYEEERTRHMGEVEQLVRRSKTVSYTHLF